MPLFKKIKKLVRKTSQEPPAATLLKSPSVSEDLEGEEEYEILEREIVPANIICPDCGGVTLE